MFKKRPNKNDSSIARGRCRAALAGFHGALLALGLSLGLVFAPAFAFADFSEMLDTASDGRIANAADTTPDAWDFFRQLPNGYGADAIKVLDLSPLKDSTHKGDPSDATSLQNMKDTIQWLKKCNELREANGLAPYKVNYTLTAIAMTDANWSLTNIGHAERFNAGENLSWGYRDPFDGWYDKEKANYDAGSRVEGEVGHYLNIINPKNALTSGGMTYTNTGFAIAEGGPYGIEHAQTFGADGMDPAYNHVMPVGLTFGEATAKGTVPVDEYERQLNAFIENSDYTPADDDDRNDDNGTDNGGFGSNTDGTPTGTKDVDKESASDSANAGTNAGTSSQGGSSSAGVSNSSDYIPGKTTLVETGDFAGPSVAAMFGIAAICAAVVMFMEVKRRRSDS